MKIAALTMAFDEAFFLPIWSRYYGRALGTENLFVIDHGSSDGAVEGLPRDVSIVRLPRAESFDEKPRLRAVTHLQHALLQYYDVVIFGDVDELVVADPAHHAGLRDALRQAPEVLSPVGLNLFQAIDREEPLDVERPILEQRSFCRFSGDYCKPVVTRTMIAWSTGFHFCDHPPAYADHVYLFHLKSLDAGLSTERLARTRAMRWSEANVAGGVSVQHRMADEDLLAAYFDKPTRALQESPDLPFDFREDVARVRASSSRRPDGLYKHDRSDGRVARIPERFRGLF